MKKITKKIITPDGKELRVPEDLYKHTNLEILKLLNKTVLTGPYQFPTLHCNVKTLPDYIALYTEPGKYNYSNRTAVAFYAYDDTFDGLFGLYNAIYYGIDYLLEFYKGRFEGVKYFISPDYSVFGDVSLSENIQRQQKMRIVSLWLTFECNAIVIPNASYFSKNHFDISFCGMEDCTVIAFSTKGHMRAEEQELTKAAIKYAVDNLPLQTIVVYTDCKEDSTVYNLFSYALENNINICIPRNTLLERNRERGVVA